MSRCRRFFFRLRTRSPPSPVLPSLLCFSAPPGGLDRPFDFFRFLERFAAVGAPPGDTSPAAPAAASIPPAELALDDAELALMREGNYSYGYEHSNYGRDGQTIKINGVRD